MDVMFEEDERWDSDRGGVKFFAEAAGDRIRCIVSREAVEDTFGGSGSREDILRLFRESREVFENEAAALIRSGRTVEVPGEPYREARILSGRLRHRPVASPTRRVTADEILGSTVSDHVMDVSWWAKAAATTAGQVSIVSDGVKFLYVDISFGSERAAADFDHVMSQFGVRVFRLQSAS